MGAQNRNIGCSSDDSATIAALVASSLVSVLRIEEIVLKYYASFSEIKVRVLVLLVRKTPK